MQEENFCCLHKFFFCLPPIPSSYLEPASKQSGEARSPVWGFCALEYQAIACPAVQKFHLGSPVTAGQSPRVRSVLAISP